MNLHELDQLLRNKTEIELLQQQNNQVINDLSKESENERFFDINQNIYRMPALFFFGEHDIYISKHNRFAPMLEHMHEFIELNYVYSGKCNQIIAGKEIQLCEGQVCVLDKDVPHSIAPLGEDDILINILLQRETISSLFLQRLSKKKSLIGEFLANSVLQHQHHNHFIIFESQHNENLQYILRRILIEYYSRQEDSMELVKAYLQIVFGELVRVLESEHNIHLNQQENNITSILNYMEEHYQHLSLQQLSNHFNYNSTYLSNKLKKVTGLTYTQLIANIKLNAAYSLVVNTNLPFEMIFKQVGYNSMSFFYKKFKTAYGATPQNIRNKQLRK
ncbi:MULTISPECIES: AraC family transcriptional regulator [Paenibacillus]|jgi:AraC-like DNA-binding protein/mannose-6-phosphate isomerase-like protein (cupin superfamily)|uniref:AraC-like DNA-binding protein/mannose-6-phosphate isomerase-like protein (Cupin superfamily) n=1 Tax=Paenibacillus peoriae TaxID=59893 RepID=A0ABU1QCA9_9BACL|nr:MULTISPECIES: helix-turn-helix domain-containing protein [Paenibacillus]AIW40998.1 AraC family transcriptional regulator [Paenibacillus polymyxa CR1]ALA43272.1 AraC family transcriptional regulator [Paenibacillus peoriae]APB74939.1 AraC family transcriptional regulator [Paenibacillus polymyxa]APQ60553.1 AraC family transcriptional regulator [Paenibacillus polymyxa]MCP3743824.1 helix-turn-helix domain-containing protein [Paenibacillus sp. A3M_27_13]